MVESVRARMTKIPAGIKSHREAPKTWDALVEWASMDHPDGADAVALKWVKEGKLSLLHRTLKTGWPPKWQTKETGFWPATPSQSISYFGAGVQIDIKLVWELHRHQYLPAVAALFAKKNDAESASELIDIMLEWGKYHPIFRTVAWMEGIEVSTRLISWCDTIAQLSPLLPDEDPRMGEIATILSKHAEWLSTHLSQKWRLNNNHLLLELAGLIVAGNALPWHPSSTRWRRIGLTLMLKELNAQTLNGRNWEPTTAYHRFVTEALLAARWSWFGRPMTGLKNRRESEAIQKIETILQQYLDTLWLLCDENSQIPLVGDDDAGVIFPRAKNWSVADSAQIFSISEAQGLLPNKEDGFKVWQQCSMGVIKRGGFHVHLTAGAPSGPARQGSHRHLDFLSCSISLNGMPVLIDPGTFTYFGSRKWRNMMRTSRVHPTVWTKSGEFASLRDLFEMTTNPLGQIERVPNGLKSKCTHPKLGYVERTVTLDGKNLVITDEGDLAKPCWSFPIPKGSEWRIEGSILIVVGNGWRLEHRPVTRHVSEIKGDIPKGADPNNLLSDNPIDGVISSGYGQIESGLRLEVDGDWREKRTTTISPFDS